MKILNLIRHAKSSWDEPSLADQERPLNKRGRKSCKIMAKPILNTGCDLQYTFCSTATRAQQTISGISDALLDTQIKWQLDDSLYTFEAQSLLDWCHKLDNTMNEIVIIGHNPALTDFCNLISGHYIDNIPTCAFARLECHINKWSQLDKNTAELTEFIIPKKDRIE